MHLSSFRHGRLRRHFALVSGLAFLWSFVLAAPAQLMAQSAAHPAKRLGVRLLTASEMGRIFGAQGIAPVHSTAVDDASGSTYPWEASVASTNTGNGNKLTSIPIVGWTARGGLPVSFTLNHNSQSAHNSELGYKWTHSYDLFLVDTSGNKTVHWGDDLSYTFTLHLGGTYTAPVGIHDTLVANVDGTYTLTRPDQTAYHFKTNLYCDTISDENGNSLTIGYNAGNYVISVTDPSSRAISLTYDGSNRISTVTDPLSRVWTCHYTSGALTSVDEPAIGGTTYSWTVSYNSAHDITTLTSPGGRSTSATYNAIDDSLATETDGCGNTTTWTESSPTTTVTDANGHSIVYTYSSGRVSLPAAVVKSP
jgi:YD repeat-containing protein